MGLGILVTRVYTEEAAGGRPPASLLSSGPGGWRESAVFSTPSTTVGVKVWAGGGCAPPTPLRPRDIQTRHWELPQETLIQNEYETVWVRIERVYNNTFKLSVILLSLRALCLSLIIC